VADQAISELLAPTLERWSRGDFSHWDDCFASDLLVTGFDADGAQRARGPEEVDGYLRRFFRQFSDYRIEVEDLEQVASEVLLMEGHQTGTGRRSGLTIRETLYIVFRFAGSNLIEMHWHPRREGALEAAGLGSDRSEAGESPFPSA